jgi:CelD/BcsL family acetyltransferase involved in cellulose biosynthesis
VASLKTIIVRSCDELREVAQPWDDLWLKSEVTTPLARAEALAQWLEHFAPQASFAAVVITDGSQFLAALPLVGGTVAKFIPCGKLPTDPWSINGDVLCAAGDQSAEALERLVAEVEQLGWPLLHLESVAFDTPRWQQIRAIATARGWQLSEHEDYRFGCIKIDDWKQYEAYWSGNHRRHMRKTLKRIEQEGGMKFEIVQNPPQADVAPLLQKCFEIEHRSWKGAAGSSVLATPGKLNYFCRIAEQMSAWGHLHVTTVEHHDWPIAFSYGLTAKGVYFAPKIGYDDAFSRLTPGQILFHEMLRTFHVERTVESVDFWGPVTDATGKWVTHDYPRGRLIMAPPRLGSRTLFRSLQRGREYVRAMRQWREQRRTKVEQVANEEQAVGAEA